MAYYRKALVLIMIFCLNGWLLKGQSNEIKPLVQGDKVPDIYLGKILNYKLKEAGISDFKGKLLILDFWSTGCIECITLFPHLKRLQDKLGDKVIIMPVGWEDTIAYASTNIRRFVEKRKGTSREMLLPTVIYECGKDSSLLRKLFPFKGMPHEIWIDSNGVFQAATDHAAISEKNIQAMLEGKNRFRPFRIANSLDLNSPFFLIQRQAPQDFVYGSVLTGYIDSLYNGSWLGMTRDSLLRCMLINCSLPDIYREFYTWTTGKDKMYNKVIVEGFSKPFYKPLSEIIFLSEDNWTRDQLSKDNLFNYELYLPGNYTLDQMQQYVIQDMDRYFKIYSRIEKRKVKCLVLKTTGLGKTKFYANPDNGNKISNYDSFINSLYNVTVSDLINQLSALTSQNYKIINETGYQGRVDIELPLQRKNLIDEIQTGLQKYDLDLVEAERELDVIVLSPDNKKK